MRRCEDEKIWRWEDVILWRWWENVKMRRCEDEKMWRCEDDVKMRRCEDEKMWRCEDAKMRRCEDEKMWRYEDGWEDVKMRRCEDEKMWRWEDERQTPTIGRTLRSDALGKNHVAHKGFRDHFSPQVFTNKPGRHNREATQTICCSCAAVSWDTWSPPAMVDMLKYM